MDSCLAAEGDTADRESDEPVAVVRGVDSVRIEDQVVGGGAITTNRGPVAAVVACDVPDKHQRRLHNSIRIS